MNHTTITFGAFRADIGLLAEQEVRATLAVCSGMSNKQIAKALDCAPGTVKKTIERVFFKFRVSSRTALVAEAFKMGLVAFSSGMTPSPQQHDHQESTNGVLIA